MVTTLNNLDFNRSIGEKAYIVVKGELKTDTSFFKLSSLIVIGYLPHSPFNNKIVNKAW